MRSCSPTQPINWVSLLIDADVHCLLSGLLCCAGWSPRDQLLTALYWLGGETNFLKTSEALGPGATTVSAMVARVCGAIKRKYKESAFVLPRGDDLERCLQKALAHRPPLPGAALFIDGTHIEWAMAPAAIQLDYTSYKGRIALQVSHKLYRWMPM